MRPLKQDVTSLGNMAAYGGEGGGGEGVGIRYTYFAVTTYLSIQIFST